MNLTIITKNHAADPEIEFLAKSIWKSNRCASAMPTAWELRKKYLNVLASVGHVRKTEGSTWTGFEFSSQRSYVIFKFCQNFSANSGYIPKTSRRSWRPILCRSFKRVILSKLNKYINYVLYNITNPKYINVKIFETLSVG